MSNKDESPACIDIREDDLLALSAEVLDTLLRDHTTGKNIFWATHDYEALGSEYDYRSEILPHLITGERGMVIRPRVLKSKEQQTGRVKDMAEVFTPSWVVKMMVDNVEVDVNTICLELTCGEAPFLISRYDAATGEPIAINERMGILDRKLRIVNGRQLNDKEWLQQVRQAFKSTYGYEWQGDSLLLARENMLYTFIDYYKVRYGSTPEISLLQDFAEIISWNLWQMDGLSYRIPQEKTKEQPKIELSFFDEAPAEAPAPLCIIMDWQKRKSIKVNDIKKRQTKNLDIMKFDVIIGNPPYQEEVEGTSNPPIYNFFMDESYKNGQIVELITPARWLFNAGKTPKEWNKKMLSNSYLKVLTYERDSSKIFSNTDIKGGVTITYYDSEKKISPIGHFIIYDEMRSVKEKIQPFLDTNLSSWIYAPESYKFTKLMHDEHIDLEEKMSAGHKYDVTTNVLDKLKDIVFFENKPNDGKEYVRIIGLENTKRVYRWILSSYINPPNNFNNYKVILPKSNGSGVFGETLSSPFVGEKRVGHTQTFISVGQLKTKTEADSLLKYLKTKFCRALLSILKVTQDNKRATWAYVPLQDFTSSSDIDWSKSIAEIDEQLFDKYGLDETERNFIRTKVKEMA
jgi:type II restriction enzyme